MNRGHYNFPSEVQREVWEHIVGMDIAMLLNSQTDTIEYTDLDISPTLLEKCVEAHNWEFDRIDRDRDAIWRYYYNSDYPHKYMCMYLNTDILDLTLDIYDTEEGEE